MNKSQYCVILIQPHSNVPAIVSTKDKVVSYDQIKQILGEDTCIDIISRSINGKSFDLIIDDEGKLKQECIVTGVINNPRQAQEIIIGPILITQHNAEGETLALDKDTVDFVLKRVVNMKNEGDFENPFGGGKFKIVKDQVVLSYGIN